MESLPDLAQCSEQEKEALIVALWAEVQRLRARLATFEAKQQEPVKDAHNSSVPPSRTHKTNFPPGPRTGTHREASVGRAGGGRALHPALSTSSLLDELSERRPMTVILVSG